MHQLQAGGDHPESSLVVKDFTIPVDTVLNMSQQCARVATKANSILGCIRKIITSRLRKVIIFLYSELMRPHLKCCVPFWAPLYMIDLSTPEQVQKGAMKTIKGKEHPVRKERLKGRIFQLEEVSG